MAVLGRIGRLGEGVAYMRTAGDGDFIDDQVSGC